MNKLLSINIVDLINSLKAINVLNNYVLKLFVKTECETDDFLIIKIDNKRHWFMEHFLRFNLAIVNCDRHAVFLLRTRTIFIIFFNNIKDYLLCKIAFTVLSSNRKQPQYANVLLELFVLLGSKV